MNRQQRRAKERENRKYAVTNEEIVNKVRKTADRDLKQAYQDGVEEGTTRAMILLLTIPLEVLLNFYWGADQRKIQKFTDHVIGYYKMWQDGKLDMDKMKEDLWKYGGVRLEESENG